MIMDFIGSLPPLWFRLLLVSRTVGEGVFFQENCPAAWYQHAVRLLALGIVVVALACGCSPTANTPAPPPASSAVAPGLSRVDPARINRIRGDLPPGYEAGAADGVASPAGFWGFRGSWTADPTRCAALIATGEPAAARGLSGSGPGGTLYIAVVGGQPDLSVPADCDQWTMTNEHSSAAVSLTTGPHIDGAQTVGMTAEIGTVVESGAETDTMTHTYTAYLGDQVVFVTLVTDPGATAPPLAPQFAADLLVASVAALRG